MPITATDRHMHAPRITREGFVAELTAHNFANATIAGACYDAVVSVDVDPLFALAIFWHESTFATNPKSVNVRYANHNPGNLRNPPPAALSIQTDRGPFLSFPTWTDGFHGMAAHLASPLYHDLTIGDVFAKWAPASDGNDPARYTAGVLDYMNQHADTGGTPVVKPPYDRTHWAADVGPKRDIADVRWFVVHDTEGSFPGDESVLTDGGGPIESVHFLIGRVPGQCVYMVPLDTTAWTAGNDQVSEQAVQVELSRNPAKGETDYTAYQYTKLAEIFTWCVAQGMVNVPAVYIGRRDADGGPEPDVPGIIGHQDVPDGNGGWGGSGHHTDPGPTFQWDRLVALIGGGPAPADKRTFPETGRAISGNVKGYWERFGTDAKGIAASMEVFGLAISDLITEGGVPVQYFERAVLEDHGPQGVMGRRCGADAARAAGLTGPGI